MQTDTCPLCQTTGHSQYLADGFIRFDYLICGSYCVDDRLVRAPTTLDHDLWPNLLGAVRELQLRHWEMPRIYFDGTASTPDSDGGTHVAVTNFPVTIREHAYRLLSNLVAMTKRFGDVLNLQAGVAYPLAYARDATEFNAYLDFLIEQGYVKRQSRTSSGDSLIVTALGFDNKQSNRELLPLTVFVSSTCYDLKDCRAEIGRDLESRGSIVLLSDDPLRFDVTPTSDSIQSCLANVRSSDVVICLIDQRYGGALPDETYANKSATHVEIDYAKEIGKPIYFFIRKEAFTEWSMLRKDPSRKSKWVESNSEEQRKRWVDFVTENVRLPDDQNMSNWFDQFETVVDLKLIVEKRLNAHRQGIASAT